MRRFHAFFFAQSTPRNPQRHGYKHSTLQHTWVSFILLIAYACFALPARSSQAQLNATQPTSLQMFVGESRIMPAPDVRRIAIGSARLLNANVLNNKEIILFANQAGSTTLSLWDNNAHHQQIYIHILPNEANKNQREVRDFISSIQGTKAKIVGDKIIIEGENLSNSDQEKIAEIAKRYPQVINFTNRIGWEKMIVMDVNVVEFPSATLRAIGVQWQGSSLGGLSAGFNFGANIDNRAGKHINRGLLFGANALFLSQLQLLAQKGEATILAQPRLSTRNGATATFFAGGEIPYETHSERDRNTIIFKPYGVKLDIAPHVDHTGTIRATIEAEVSSIDTSIETKSGPALRTRRTKTEFNIREGQTMILSGFLNREHLHNQDKIPGLGDIPILGTLFRSEKFIQRETELVVFVTPHISTEDEPTKKIQQTQEKLEQLFGPSPLSNPNNNALPSPKK
ncbi:MAG: pilus assembly protein N-terminal domain-containing protein [Ottowia sp.]|nr:pilus assembly protein N-terminal domain-containing protein [Ottowia sp.]